MLINLHRNIVWIFLYNLFYQIQAWSQPNSQLYLFGPLNNQLHFIHLKIRACISLLPILPWALFVATYLITRRSFFGIGTYEGNFGRCFSSSYASVTNFLHLPNLFIDEWWDLLVDMTSSFWKGLNRNPDSSSLLSYFTLSFPRARDV